MEANLNLDQNYPPRLTPLLTRLLTQQLGDCLGRGAFGSVYRGLNWTTGETVAVKQIQLGNIPKSELGEIMVSTQLQVQVEVADHRRSKHKFDWPKLRIVLLISMMIKSWKGFIEREIAREGQVTC